MLKRVALLLFIGFILLALPTFIPLGAEDPRPEMEIYLLSNEIHTDIAVPVRNAIFDWETFIDPRDFKERPSEWIEIGWGDRQFYFEMPTWDQFTLKLGLGALLTPDEGIIHLNYLNAHPKQYASAKRVRISHETYKKLVVELKKRFKLQNHKPILIPNKGYTQSDNFYESYGSFSLIRTCNVWTSEVLGEVGLVHPLWSPTKLGLELFYSK